ncbi:MAG: hypothetical protein DRI34_03050 [Deltaproteobacteria bacterium]|nr:MAG: hypothetical protein DRI34_03050 [Deltaproteobacteria bacterium]
MAFLSRARAELACSESENMAKRSSLPLSLLLLALMPAAGCDDVRFITRQPPGTQVDIFEQTSVPVVDVLWVVDNSASMAEEQQALADNFGAFFDYLQDAEADFHIGVTSTDIYNPDHQGRLLGDEPVIDNDTPDAAAVFAANVNVGTEGKGDEQGLACALLALTEPLLSGDNFGFLRDQAYLFIIFVSDEDDRSFGPEEYYVRRFEQIKDIGNDGMVTVAAVVGDVPEVPPACREQKHAEPGRRYAEVAEQSGGLALSICDDDFSVNLDALGFSAAGLKRTFTLTRAPDPRTIAVWIKTTCATAAMPGEACSESFDDCGGAAADVYGRACVVKQSLPDGFVYDEEANSIRFFGLALPPFGAVVQVGYVPLEEGG